MTRGRQTDRRNLKTVKTLNIIPYEVENKTFNKVDLEALASNFVQIPEEVFAS